MRRSLTNLAAAALVIASCTSGVSADRSSSAGPTIELPSATPTEAGPSPTLVPAGRIAFGTFDPAVDGFLIYTVRPDGSNERQLLPDAHEIPIWSPDSAEIAVTGGGPRVFATIVHADGSASRTLKVPDPTLTMACSAWSPDGTLCASEGWDDTTPGREGVYLVNLTDGSGLKRLTSPSGGIHDSPGSFSPDGKQIVFVRRVDEANDRGELRIINVDGTNVRTLGDRLVDLRAAYSPDGRFIAAATAHTILIFAVADLSASPKEISLPAAYASHDGVNWSPDGTRFVVGLFRPGFSAPNLYTMNVDGTDLWQVTHRTQESTFGTWGLPPG